MAAPPAGSPGPFVALLGQELADRKGVCWNFLSPFVSGNSKEAKDVVAAADR